MKYFDYASTTPTSEEALQEYIHVSRNYYANPGSDKDVKNYENKLKKQLLDCISMKNYELIFTSGGTESNNLAIKGIIKNYHEKHSHFITSSFEHASVYEVFKKLEQGNSVSYINICPDGRVDLTDFKNKLQSHTKLVCVMSVNNELGTKQPIEDLYKITRNFNKNIIFMVDHIQGLTKIPLFNVEPDIITISSHKIYGPKAVGAVVVKKGLKLSKIILGGNKEENQRGGTQSLPAQAGFVKAACTAMSSLDANIATLKRLREYTYNLIKQHDYITLNAVSDTNVISIRIDGDEESNYYLNELYKRDYLLSSKSADSGMSKTYSRTLEAIGLTKDQAYKTLRISISQHTKQEDLDVLFEQINEIHNLKHK